MNASAPPQPTAQAATVFALALALSLALMPCPSALASGALPWLAPGQQQNASAANATDKASAPGPVNSTDQAAQAVPIAAAQPTGKPATMPTATPAIQPDDAAAQAQREVLRQYFRRQLTLAEDFPEVFSRRVRDGEALAFQAMCEMQRRRGVLGRFRSAQVDLSGLSFTHVTNAPDLARIRVTGSYAFTLGPRDAGEDGQIPRMSMDPKVQTAEGPPVRETLDEDALFVLLPEMGQWKIYERREGWRPWP